MLCSWISASWYNCENNQQDILYRLIYYSKSAQRVPGYIFAHHQEHLTVFTVSGSVHPSCCRLVSWMNWNCKAVSIHPRHQPAATWVNTTRYCKYSHVLLMMDENIVRNMYSWLGIINEPIYLWFVVTFIINWPFIIFIKTFYVNISFALQTTKFNVRVKTKENYNEYIWEHSTCASVTL
jgi:hypothetical protein